ncbi:MAG: Hpt domain-containing protein, partial [Anaerolineales bacterium]
MKFSDNFLPELLAIFAVEAQEHIQAINQHLLVLEKSPDTEQAGLVLEEIFREAHSLKGAARAVNLETVGLVAHELETLFGHLREGQVRSSPELFDLI